jgi:hypothetical protein
MLIAVLGFGHIWNTRGARGAKGAAHFNTTGILSGGKYRCRSCIYGHIRIDECTGFHPEQAHRSLSSVFDAEQLAIWNGSRKLFLKKPLPKGTEPERYVARIWSAEVGWIDRRAAWLCDDGEVVSFSEGNGEQEVLVLLPAFGWIAAGGRLFHFHPDGHRPWHAQFHCMEEGR